MQADLSAKADVNLLSLQLEPSVCELVKTFSEKEGISMNDFVNAAVAEKVSQLRHEEWVKNRKKPTQEDIAEALRLLARAGGQPPEPGDELPVGYVRMQVE